MQKPVFRTVHQILLFAIALAFAPLSHAQRGPENVFAQPVEAIEFSNRIEALGTLDANERVELRANVSDRVTGVFFEDGERVKAGDTLVSLIQTEQAARVAGAVAMLKEARAVVERMEPLVSDGAVAMVTYESAKRDVAVAEAELTALRIQQKERVLVAPFDGLLGFRRVSKGGYLTPSVVVTTLVDDSVMKLDFEVPSTRVAQLRPGIAVEALTDDFPGEAFSGEITSIDNMIDPVTRAVTVRAIIPNDNLLLRAGTFMNVIVNAAPSEGLAIPEEAIQPRGPKNFVFLVVDEAGRKIARRQEIEIGRRQGNQVEVIAGLNAGDMVITEGVIRIREGAEVVIANKDILFPSPEYDGSVRASASVSNK